MSYILDALNKSENERRAGAIPGMAAGASFMVAPQRSSSRRGSAAILVGVGMLATGLALGSWRPWQNVPVPPPVELAAASPAAAAPQPAAPPALGEAPATASPAVKPVAQLKPQPTVPVVTKPKTPPKPPVTVQAEAPAPAAVIAEAPPKAAKAEKAEKAPKVAAAEAEAPANRVVAYRELPAKVQKRLPAISFGGFAGVDESEVKIAFINNRLVKEGEEVSPGLKLEKVGNEGVVLAYQGHRFRP